MANFLEVLNAIAARGGVPGPSPMTPPFVGRTSPALPLTFPAPPAPGPMIIPPAPVDERGIENEYLSFLGTEPVAPKPPADPGFVGRLALALQGFSAGVQGQGPQFLAQLREERERPIREYEQKKERFEERKFQLKIAGREAATRAKERQQARLAQQEDQLFQQEVQEKARKQGIVDQQAFELFRDSLQRQRDAEREQREIAENQRKEAEARKVQVGQLAGKIAGDFKDVSVADAKTLAEFNLGVITELPPRLRNKKFQTIQEYITRLQIGARREGGGTTGIMVQLSNNQSLPFEAYAKVQSSLAQAGIVPTQFIMPQAAMAITPQAIDLTIANDQRAGTPGTQTAAKLRGLPGYAVNKEMIEGKIKAAGLDRPQAAATPQPSSSIVGGTVRGAAGLVKRGLEGALPPGGYIPMN